MRTCNHLTGKQDTNADHGAGVVREKCVVCTQPKGMCSDPLFLRDLSRVNAGKKTMEGERHQ